MLSFRQKIFITYIILFFLFLAALYPLAIHTVQTMISRSLEERADELIAKIKNVPDDYAMVATLKEMKNRIFFRVGVLNESSKIVYDSHAKRRLGANFSQEFVLEHPEITDALDKGVGVFEGESTISDQRMFYMAKAFDFHGKKYILRVAIPQTYVKDATLQMQLGLLFFSVAVLLVFSVMTWVTINHLTSPIQRIIAAVRPYQEGAVDVLPEIEVAVTNPKDEFRRLADTLNSLSKKIRAQINNLKEARNEKVAVLESLVEGVVAIDDGMVVTYANGMALRFLGKKNEELIGNTFFGACPYKCEELVLSCLRENQLMIADLEIEVAGRKVYLDIIAAPKEDKSGAVLVMQDKSAHYRILEMRKDFIANASHELRTPITIIRGFAETLHDNPEMPSETRVQVTEKIVRNCERMTHLIKDLLTLADIEHLTESQLLPCHLPDLISNCCSMLQEMYPEAVVKIEMESGEDVDILGDSQLLELALINLLVNAAKYSKAPQQIAVGLKRVADTVQLSVADKGMGIPPEDIDHIFHRFYRVDKAHSRKLGGAGLGLSLVETIIQKHRGTISVVSELGKGSTFTISLPVS